ncbi:MAG TPA: NAD-dependent epimerase/dehydratase family protein [Anaerolineae bacterium]|nr:NAD-dependent epimerase/dehydratase family protein [Anaerolineae bacterium]
MPKEEEGVDLAGRTVVVTGASGFVGGHLAARLATRERACVRALVRPTSRIEHLRDLGIHLCPGSITEPGSLRAAFDGADMVFHCAALVREWGKSEDLYRTNALGTENVLIAAAGARVARVIHTSSVAVYGLEPDDGTDEASPLNHASGNPYADSKIAAEVLVQRYAHERGLNATILRPADIYGPRSTTGTLGPVVAIKLGWMELIDGGEGLTNHLYVDNLVDAYVLAAQKDQSGCQAYIISDGVGTTWREFFGRYARMMGKGALPSIPKETAMLKAAEAEAKAERTGRPPFLTRAAVTLMTQKAVFRLDKACRELSYAPRISLDEGMRLTEEWLRAKRYI